MRSAKFLTFMFLVSISIMGCNQAPGPGETDNLKIKTEGIYTEPTLEVEGGNYLGEFLIDSVIKVIKVRVKNNAKFEMFDMSLTVASTGEGYTFRKDPTENDIGYPGYTINSDACGTSLPSLEECVIYLQYDPITAGTISTDITLNYKNLVDQASMTLTISALAGEAASIIFIDEITNYDHGIVEQTVPTPIHTDLILKNAGGLTARSITTNLYNDNTPEGFSISSTDCPVDLEPNETCNVRITFIPQNTLDTDPGVDYSANLKFQYINDPMGTLAFLNGYWNVASRQIRGEFTSGLPLVEFFDTFGNDIIVGNKVQKDIKITNNGDREAILQKIIFKHAVHGGGAGGLWAECTAPAVAGDFLDCVDHLGAPIGVADQFPFKLKDVTGCLNAETPGIVPPATQGSACFFEMHFHPSTTLSFATTHDFDNTKLYFEYDARWKDQVTIEEPLLYTAMAKAVGAARFEIESIEFDNAFETELSRGNIDPAGESTWHFFDVGRRALISDYIYFTPLNVRIRNIGSSRGSVTAITAMDKLTGGTLQNIVASPQINVTDYYRDADSTCFAGALNPNETCQINMKFAPKAFGNQALEDEQMYDVNNSPTDRYKMFDFHYTDGTTVNDDDSPRVTNTTQARFTATLVQKGYLTYDIGRAANDGNLPGAQTSGTSQTHEIKITNVGTGTIPYIKYRQFDADNGYNFELLGTADNYPFTIVPTDAGSLDANTFDCFNIIDRGQFLGGNFVVDTFSHNQSAATLTVDAGHVPVTPDPSWALAQSKSCILTIQSEMRSPDAMTWEGISHPNTEMNTFNSVSERGREWHIPSDNTLAIRYFNPFFNNANPEYVSFEYFDGDWPGRAADPTLDLYEYGDLFVIAPGAPLKDDEYAVSTNFQRPASIAPVNPLPMASAIIYRPPINYPDVGIPTDSFYRAAKVVPEWWDYGDFFALGNEDGTVIRSMYSKAVSKAAYDPSYEYVVHIGTFPVGQSYGVQFQLKNYGQRGAQNLVADWDSVNGTHPIQFDGAGNFPLTGSGLGSNGTQTALMTFTPTVAGTFSRILEYTYDNRREIRTKRIKVEGIAVSGDYADLDFEVENWNVIYDPDAPPATETLSGTRAPLTSHLVRMPAALPTDLNLQAVKRLLSSSPITTYTRKRIHINNNTTAQNIKNIRIFFKQDSDSFLNAGNLSSIGVPLNHPTKAGEAGIQITNDACILDAVDLTPGDSCTVDLTFAPFISGSRFYELVVSYEISTGQYIEEYIRIEFEALEPANVIAQGLTTDPVNNRDSIPQNAYPLLYGNVTLTNYPTTALPTQTVTMQNLSTLAASFLKQWQCYQEEQNPLNHKVNTNPLPHVGEPAIWKASSCQPDPDRDAVDEYNPVTEVRDENVGAGTWTTIYEYLGVRIEASRQCFYGDGTYTAPDPTNYSKGFTSTSSDCTLYIYYDANEDYVMQLVNSTDTLIQLYYYDFERNSFNNNLHFYLNAFILPNPVDSGNYNNVIGAEDGSVHFEWDPMSNSSGPANPNWGPIDNYRIFGATSANELNSTRIYSVPSLYASSFTVPVGTEIADVISQTVTGLDILPGTYYYFKVAAERTVNGKTYYVDSGMPTLKVLVPPAGTYYDAASNLLVDKDHSASVYTRDGAISYCNGQVYDLNDGGSITSIIKLLIDSSIHAILKADDTASNYIYWSSQHWLSDAAIDIGPLFSACKTYDPGKSADSCADFPSGEDPVAYLIYSKGCTNSSCDMLYKAYGTINTFNEQFYTNNDNLGFYARCWAIVP